MVGHLQGNLGWVFFPFVSYCLVVWLLHGCNICCNHRSRWESTQKPRFYLLAWHVVLMATCSGWLRKDFWDNKSYNPCNNPCPYKFSQILKKCWFDEITPKLCFTNIMLQQSLITSGGLVRWCVHRIKRWLMFFCPLECSFWMRACPFGSRGGLALGVFCPRKQHPFGNEYHTACCG